MNFYDILFARKMANQGDITTEGLSVTENGTYTAPTGKAYTPVVVNVQGYAKKSIANTPTAIATFNASALPMPSLTVGIEAVQSGTGDPSPTNIRPITGWSAVNVYDNDGNWWDEQYEIYGSGATARIGSKNPIPCKGGFTYYITKNPAYGWKFYDSNMNVLLTWYNQTCTAPQNACFMSFQLDDAYGTTYNNDVCINTVSTTYYVPYSGTTYTIQLGDTYYGTTLDVVSGELTVDSVSVTYDGSSDENWLSYAYGYYIYSQDMKSGTDLDGLCNMLTKQSPIDRLGFKLGSNNKFIYINQVQNEWGISDVSELRSFLSEKNLQFTYPLATPITIQLTPTAVKSLLGTNNLWADSGNVLSGEYLEAL